MLKIVKSCALGTLSALSTMKCHQTSRSIPVLHNIVETLQKTSKNKLSHNDFIRIFPWKL